MILSPQQQREINCYGTYIPLQTQVHIKIEEAYQKLLELKDTPMCLKSVYGSEDFLGREMALDYASRKYNSQVQELFADKAKKEDGEPMSLTKHCYIINARNMKTGEQHTFYPKRGDLSRFLKEPRSIARCSFDTDNIMDLDEVQEFIDENLVGKFHDLVVSKVVEHIKIKFESQLDKCA